MAEIMTQDERRELRELTRAAERRDPGVSWTLRTAADIGARLGRRYLGDARLLASSSDIAAEVRYEPGKIFVNGRSAYGRISGESGRLTIQVDATLSAGDQAHVLAHECAHKLLGPGPDEERGCEVFAEAFLAAGRAARFAFFGERPAENGGGAFDRAIAAAHRPPTDRERAQLQLAVMARSRLALRRPKASFAAMSGI